MMTWRLWFALQEPFIEHPLYWHQSRRFAQDYLARYRVVRMLRRIRDRMQGKVWFWLLMIYMIPLILVLLVGWQIVLILALAGFPLLVLTLGLLTGVLVAFTISESLTQERMQGRQELLSLTPSGSAGAAWAVSTALFCRHPIVRRVRRVVSNVYGMLLIGLVLLFFFLISIILLTPFNNASDSGALLVFSLIVVILAIVFDFYQSNVVGALFGMLVPFWMTNAQSTRSMAVAGFVALQAATYVVTGLMALTLVSLGVALFDFQVGGVYLLVTLVIFYGLRELIIRVLWNRLLKFLDATTDEMLSMTGIADSSPLEKVAVWRT